MTSAKCMGRMVWLLICLATPGRGTAQTTVREESLYAVNAVSRIDGDWELLASLAAAHDSLDVGNGLMVSFGGLLGDTPIVGVDDGETFYRSAGEAGIDYMLLSAPELMYGIGRLRELDSLAGAPGIVAANLVDERSRRPVFAPYITRTIGGRKILLIGMADPETIRRSNDANVAGIDIIPFDEAVERLTVPVMLEYPDIVVVAGKLDRDGVVALARRFQSIDYFITDRGGSFTGAGTVRAASVAGKPVYIVPEKRGNIGTVAMKRLEGVETVAVGSIAYAGMFPPDPVITGHIESVIGQIARAQQTESAIRETGRTVTSLLYDMFDVDAVFIERQSLYYFPIEDSLNVTNVEKVIKPYTILKAYDLKGSEILSILEQNRAAQSDQRLNIAGILQDAKIDSIPIQEDRDYFVMTTTFLRLGGHDYDQFTRGTAESGRTADMLETVAQHLVAREERIREAMKPKYWEMNLHLNIGSYFNKQDVNGEKAEYGSTIPKPFRDQKDNFVGNFKIESWNNTFKYAKNNHQYDITLHMKYVRAGTRSDSGDIVYHEADDNLILYNKYTYNHPGLGAKPYIDNTINSELYSSGGKHPVTVKLTTGLTRKFPLLLNMVLNIGFSADRNYVTNVNGMGADSKITFDQSFEGNSVLARKTTLHSETVINYKPMSRYHMAFYLQNRNNITVNLMKKIDMIFNVNSYVYRDTTLRKVAVGVFYDFSLNYAMDWTY